MFDFEHFAILQIFETKNNSMKRPSTDATDDTNATILRTDVAPYGSLDLFIYKLAAQISRDHEALGLKVNSVATRLDRLEAVIDKLEKIVEKVEVQTLLSKQKLGFYERAGWIVFATVVGLASRFF